jgi:HAD superfamily hydrolase (TIGR01549 family)
MNIVGSDKDLPLVSIIIPTYGTEQVLPRCLDSILNCTYKNLEIIVVNDCSPGNASEIVNGYASMDSRIRLVEHEKNKGLYLARMTGVAASHGKYIAFLDSDDQVSVDLYRRLVEKAETTDSDMVMGEVIMDFGNRYEYYNYAMSRILDIDLTGREIADLLFHQMGRDWSLHVVWNKLYRRDLWDKCLPYFQLQTGHLIMCEDVLYSSFFYYFATHFTNIHGDFVYYTQSDSASTHQKNKPVNQIEKSINDIRHVFDILYDAFHSRIKDDTYLEDIRKWQGNLKGVWIGIISHSKRNLFEKRKLLQFLGKDMVSPNKGGQAFGQAITSQKKLWGEELKRKICDRNTEVVSFDIFDTLVYRPFWDPTGLFYLLGIYVDDVLHAGDMLSFRDVRMSAEKRAREIGKISHSSWEDITLDNIYDVIQDWLGISQEERQQIEDKEIELELKYCHPRRYAKELFDMCRAIGKRVVITSDMYLPKAAIEEILEHCGYSGYEKLYLSSEVKLGKWSGNLYTHLCKDLGVTAAHVLHIGDTLPSDVKMAKKMGLQSFHFPKAVDRFMNTVPQMYGGELFIKVYGSPLVMRDGWQFMRFFGLQCLLATAANEVFSNPYVQFHPETDFNADPNVIGTFALGMHMFAVAQWLADEVKKNGYDNLNFMARDGYLPMKCFDELNRIYQLPVRKDYLYLTRSVMLPLQVDESYDLAGMVPNFNIFSQTPKKLFEEFEPIMSRKHYVNRENFCKDHGFIIDKRFSTLEEYYDFIKVFKDDCIDRNKVEAYKSKVYQYLKPAFQGKSATFDVGYSCRVESTLKRNYGFDVTPYYIHVNNHIPFYRAQKRDMDFHTFYKYSPGVTGVVRELLISKLAPSCDHLEIQGERIVPVFKSYHPDFMETYMVSCIQKSALRYVKTVVDLFGSDIRYLYYQRGDVSLPFEYYLSMSKIKDRQIFAYSDFEDDLGIGKSVSTYDYWNGQIENVASGLSGAMDWTLHWIPSKWQRAICLYYMNRDYLKYKVSVKMAGHPQELALLKAGYRGMRRLYRMFRKK